MKQIGLLRLVAATSLVIGLAAGCGRSADDAANAPPTANTPDESATVTVDDPLNVFAWSLNVMSGAEPRDETGFQSLASRKVKTVVCVDSAGSFAELVTKHNLRFFHVPIQYDGVSGDALAALIAIAHDAPAPIYTYSFDGPTRGAVAAAIIARERNEITPGMVKELLNRAGARKRYTTLYEVVEMHSPGTGSLIALNDVPDHAQVSERAEHMSQIGRAWPALGAWRSESANSTNRSLPDDLAPLVESANTLAELFSKLLSSDMPDRDERFLRSLRMAHLESLALRQLLEDHDAEGFFQGVTNLSRSCRDCHNAHRNGPGLGDE